MIILDCESLASAISSVESIFAIPQENIVNDLISIDFEKEYEHRYNLYEYPEFGECILNHFVSQYNIKPNSVERICWFHLSRSLNPKSFRRGILPLDNIIDKLFDDMYFIVKDKIDYSIWMQIKEKATGNSNFAYLYNTKRYNPMHQGPYAMLVKDIAFSACGNHDYLGIPEIIEDVGYVVEEMFGISFIKKFKEKSSSVIVKF